MQQARRDTQHRPRELRRRVIMPARLRSCSGWTDACILNISSRGLLVHSARTGPAGSIVEVWRGDHVIVARVVWHDGARAGLEAEDKLPVVAGTVYVATPDYHLLVDAGPRLALSVDEPVHYSRPSLDVLFESAADIYRERLVGVVLTGGNEDGAVGLAAVQRNGGMTIVQQPGSAYASLMPASALKRVAADFVLTLEEIAELVRTSLRRGGAA